jgi:transcriptional regulator with XRE-family HTH domain
MTKADSPRFNEQAAHPASQSFGEVLREVRETTGVSVRSLARDTAYSPSHLRSVENGNRKATQHLVAACDDALGAGGVLVTLALAEATDDQLRRRAVLASLGTLTAIGMPSPRLVSEALRSDLLSALGGSDWTGISGEYGRRFVVDSPEEFQLRLTGDLLVLRSALSGGSSGANSAAPSLMMLQGMVTANLGDRDASSRWYQSARLAAEATHDERSDNGFTVERSSVADMKARNPKRCWLRRRT